MLTFRIKICRSGARVRGFHTKSIYERAAGIFWMFVTFQNKILLWGSTFTTNCSHFSASFEPICMVYYGRSIKMNYKYLYLMFPSPRYCEIMISHVQGYSSTKFSTCTKFSTTAVPYPGVLSKSGMSNSVYTVPLGSAKLLHSARGERARVSINFRKFSPCMAHAARARRARAGLTVYPPSRTLDLFAFDE
jgi:hypothetical protein